MSSALRKLRLSGLSQTLEMRAQEGCPNTLPQPSICVEYLEAAAATQRKGSETPVAERLNMKLSEYFENSKGIGVLATTDLAGQVNQAIYAKPLFLDKNDDGTCSFVMANRLTHNNVGHNPSASYLFIEEGNEYVGKRLSLVVIEEEVTPEKIKALRRCTALGISEEDSKYLVHCHIEGVRPLIGNE